MFKRKSRTSNNFVEQGAQHPNALPNHKSKKLNKATKHVTKILIACLFLLGAVFSYYFFNLEKSVTRTSIDSEVMGISKKINSGETDTTSLYFEDKVLHVPSDAKLLSSIQNFVSVGKTYETSLKPIEIFDFYANNLGNAGWEEVKRITPTDTEYYATYRLDRTETTIKVTYEPSLQKSILSVTLSRE
ncbi:hypothetical protein H6802_00285 [Candidatus Nomurabacteria bacterium]|uniref:Uncharacterized protein n=1 Tax=candidate division WWE3 bacterium TaxID=2053526 RepID=A0A955IW00_UNCKA|nr:hypothetical protein [candidate division WWE3 bacterium]MCB9823389.1 hypothetical protein [Candidatus Nomurabacteria bacterium]MCB9827671.1 hypothetical protein [Candidatus Nomurabacteria bacterium]